MNVFQSMKKEMLRTLICGASLFLFFGCVKKEVTFFDPSSVDLFIEMPKSINIFENVAPVFYEVLYEHFSLADYKLSSSTSAAFRLESLITRYDTEEKLVSPDVLPYVFRMWLDVECSLLDREGKLVAKKKFTFSSFASRPIDVHYTSHFAVFEFKRMVSRFVPRIDHYFRRFLTALHKERL